MPAYHGARTIFSQENLLKVVGGDLSECSGVFPYAKKEVWHVISLLQPTAIEVIAPTQGDNPPFTEEAMKVELLERKGLHVFDNSGGVGRRKHIWRITKSLRQI